MTKKFFRTLLLGSALCIGLAFLEPYAVHIRAGSPLCADFSTGGALLFLFILVFFVNSLWRLLHRRSSLDSEDLSLLYIMLIIACSIISWGFVLNLLPLLAGLQYYAHEGNQWNEIILKHIPKYLLPQGKEVIRTFYEGLSPGKSIPWSAWIKPLFFWTTFITAAYFLMLSVYTFFRKTWIEKENLFFPLIQLPLALTKQPSDNSLIPPILRNKLFWFGFAIPFLVYSIKAIHTYFPLLGNINLTWYVPIMRRCFSLRLSIFFEVIGLSFLISTNLSLSIWLFALYAAFMTGYCNMTGLSIGGIEPVSDPSIPIVAHQVYGALFAFVIYLIWRSRRNIADIFLKAFGKKPEVDDSDELFSHRTTVFGSFIAFAYLVFYLNRMGVNTVAAIFYLLVTYIILIGLTRAVAQGGVAYGRPPVSPFFVTTNTLGTNFLGSEGITGLGLQNSWSGDARTFVMASAANSSKIASERKIKMRKVAIAIWIAIFVTLISAYISGLRVAYCFGGLNTAGWHYRGLPQCIGGIMQNKINFPGGMEKMKLVFEGVGVILMSVLIFMQSRFLWWPIHPLGLAIGSTSPSQWVWFSIFWGWLLKTIILKFGGVKVYRAAIPFFLGLIMGGFVAAGFWVLIDSFTGMVGNSFTLG